MHGYTCIIYSLLFIPHATPCLESVNQHGAYTKSRFLNLCFHVAPRRLRFTFIDKWTFSVAVMPCGNASFPRSVRAMSENLKSCIPREPAPTNGVRTSIGDVGFIRNGHFHLLFSAARPLGERQRGVDVPLTFEELTIGTPVFSQPRMPGCLCTDAVRRVGAGLGATVPVVGYVLSIRPPSTDFNNMPLSALEPGAHLSFELTGTCGAALATKYLTYREDSILETAFEG